MFYSAKTFVVPPSATLFVGVNIKLQLRPTKTVNAKAPYKPAMPFQFFLFYASFFYLVLKKKVSLLIKKIKHYKVNQLHLDITGGEELATLPNFLELMGSVSAGLGRLSLGTLSLFINFFFIHFSKKQILTVLRINQGIQRAVVALGAKGFSFSHKGKLA